MTNQDKLHEVAEKLYQLCTEVRPSSNPMRGFQVQTTTELLDAIAEDIGAIAMRLGDIVSAIEDYEKDYVVFSKQLEEGDDKYPSKSKQEEFFHTDSIGEKHEGNK